MATKPKEVKLPNKLSGLLRLAVKDCRKAQKSKKYKLNMRVLHEPPNKKGKCEVCMAGAILAFTMKVPINSYILSFGAAPYAEHELHTVDLARQGRFVDALHKLNKERLTTEQSDVVKKWSATIENILTRDRHRANFSIYEKAADELKTVGL